MRIRGCRQHNLKGIDLDLPTHQLVVVTGPSGSGKSSLVLDTIAAEGRRRYLECLALEGHAQLRGWPQPDVDAIWGLPPALAISQPPRSHGETVATRTDVYELLAILYAHASTVHSPVTGQPLRRYTLPEMVVEVLKRLPANSRYQLLAPIRFTSGEEAHSLLERLRRNGFVRTRWAGAEYEIDALPDLGEQGELELVVDRLIAKPELAGRLQESLQIALTWGGGSVRLLDTVGATFELHTDYVCPESGERYRPLAPADFHFWSARGRCPICLGRGRAPPTDPRALIDLSQPIGPQMDQLIQGLPARRRPLYRSLWQALAAELAIDLEQPLGAAFQEVLFWGRTKPVSARLTVGAKGQGVKGRRWRGQWHGIASWTSQLTPGSSDEWPLCSTCDGSGLNALARGCRIHGLTLYQLCQQSVEAAVETLESWTFTGAVEQLAQPTLIAIRRRLMWMGQLGLGYLQLNRAHTTLSVGEAQRLHLAGQLGGRLSGVLYCLDEPSAGLHPGDLSGLLAALQQLKAEGNGILLVEHNEELIRAADHLIELGPGGGAQGGTVIFQGTLKEHPTSPTARWLHARPGVRPEPLHRPAGWISLQHLALHNLKNIDVEIPLGVFCCVCGVSGSGKSTLALDALGRPLQRGQIPSWLGSTLDLPERLVLLEQQESGLSENALAASIMGLMEPIQKLFVNTRLAQARGYSTSFFSLHRKGGRCEGCAGRGTVRFAFPLIEPVEATCDLCHGARYSAEALQVTWQGYTIADLLAMTAREAAPLATAPEIVAKLQLMDSVGLGYLTLGQRAATLSAGERQRLRLVAELSTHTRRPTLYILDEPSRGLHASDVEQLIHIFHRLTEEGHTLLAVEHNLDILGSADWLIELGPGGGPQGGNLLYAGPPKGLVGRKTPTGKALR